MISFPQKIHYSGRKNFNKIFFAFVVLLVESLNFSSQSFHSVFSVFLLFLFNLLARGSKYNCTNSILYIRIVVRTCQKIILVRVTLRTLEKVGKFLHFCIFPKIIFWDSNLLLKIVNAT